VLEISEYLRGDALKRYERVEQTSLQDSNREKSGKLN